LQLGHFSSKQLFRAIGVKILPPIAFFIMRLLWLTYKKKYHFIDAPIEEQCMAVTWHGELLISPQAYRALRKNHKTSAIISQHHDGDIIAKILSYFQIKALRGSSKKGAKSVLISAIKSLKDESTVMITPDGPRGPKHTMHDGAVALAIKAKLPLMIINFKATSYWQLKSWDEFVIPKPFTTIDIYHQVLNISTMNKDKAKSYLKTQMLTYSI